MAYTRTEIRAALRKKVDAGNPLVVSELGSGLAARVADAAGTDLIVLSSYGLYRADGAAACGAELAYVDTNTVAKEQGERILDHIKKTPVLAGIGVGDPFRDVDRFVDEMLAYGYSGVTNSPTTCQWEGHFSNTGQVFELVGFPEEVRFLKRSSERGIFTLARCYLENQARAVAEAGLDVIVIELGATDGGMLPATSGLSQENAIEQLRKLCELIRHESPESFVLFHGGPFADPETVRTCIRLSGVDGVFGGSLIERIPVERAIYDTIRSLAEPVR